MTTHLTEEEISMCADALQQGSYDQLPGSIKEHLAECDQCANEVLLVADVSQEMDFKLERQEAPNLKRRRFIVWGTAIAASLALLFIVFDGSRKSDDGSNYLAQEQQLSESSPQNETDQGIPAEEQATEEINDGTRDVRDEQNIASPDEEARKNIASNEGMESTDVPAESGDVDKKVPAASMPPALVTDECDTLRLLAQAETNEKLEKLVNRFEGRLRDNGDVQVQAPVTIVAEGSTALIKWENPENRLLIIEVIDNMGQKVFEAETRDQEYTLTNLAEGLYYWKLISGEDFDLLFCGRILVK